MSPANSPSRSADRCWACGGFAMAPISPHWRVTTASPAPPCQLRDHIRPSTCSVVEAVQQDDRFVRHEFPSRRRSHAGIPPDSIEFVTVAVTVIRLSWPAQAAPGGAASPCPVPVNRPCGDRGTGDGAGAGLRVRYHVRPTCAYTHTCRTTVHSDVTGRNTVAIRRKRAGSAALDSGNPPWDACSTRTEVASEERRSCPLQ